MSAVVQPTLSIDVSAGRRRRTAFVAGLAVGVWFVPLAQVLAARYAGRHFLDIVNKEKNQ